MLNTDCKQISLQFWYSFQMFPLHSN